MGKYTFPSGTTSSSPDGSPDAPTRDTLGISQELLPPLQNAASSNVYIDESVLVGRYELQSAASELEPKERVATCHHSIIGGAVTLLYIPESGTSAFGNIETCGSVWMCAVCSARISYDRKKDLDIALKNARAMGLQVAMCTYTFSHHKGDKLREHVDAMLKARRDMVSGRASREIKETYGEIGRIRSIEVTFGPNGGHPHIHELVFFEPGADVAGYGDAMRERWMHVAARQGLTMNEHGFQLDMADDKIAQYIAKFGREPGEKTRKALESGEWNEASELTQWHRKRGLDEHLTPFDLLRLYRMGDVEAGRLFQVYAQAFKGRRQLYFPGPLREKLGLPRREKTDKEIVEDREFQKQVVAALSRKLFYSRIVPDRRKKDARAKVRMQVSRHRGDIEAIAEYLISNFDALRDDTLLAIPYFDYEDDVPIANDYKQ